MKVIGSPCVPNVLQTVTGPRRMRSNCLPGGIGMTNQIWLDSAEKLSLSGVGLYELIKLGTIQKRGFPSTPKVQ